MAIEKSNWGGARVGSGAKPQVHTIPGTKDPELATPPEDMPEDEQGFWRNYAPLAIEKGTLTTHTVAAFRLLCELDAEKRKTRSHLDTQGRTFIKITVDGAGVEHQELKAHPLTGAYGRIAKAVEALMARFGLAPFGKPEPVRAKAKAPNAFQQNVG
jgi:phage terminase small subunit